MQRRNSGGLYEARMGKDQEKSRTLWAMLCSKASGLLLEARRVEVLDDISYRVRNCQVDLRSRDSNSGTFLYT